MNDKPVASLTKEEQNQRCEGLTKRYGRRCRNKAVRKRKLCWHHLREYWRRNGYYS